MLDDSARQYLIEGHRRFEKTKDRTHIDDAIRLVQTISPQSFLQNDKDKEKRAFYHAPFSVYWSGTAVTHENAYPVMQKGGK
jgi:hypothetical protein